jgi:hypothetical protein
MRYRVTVNTTADLLATIVQVLSDSRITDFRIEPVDLDVEPVKAKRRRINPKKQPSSERYVLNLIHDHPGLTPIELSKFADPALLSKSSVGPCCSRLWRTNHVRREPNGRRGFIYWVKS